MTTIKLKNGSGAPTAGDLVQGEPALDLTNKRLYTEDSGGTVIEVGTNPSTINIDAGTIDGAVIGGSSAAAITGTTITGTSFVSSGNMTFGDNDKAIFGAGSDLEIYHNASDSIINDNGTGSLKLQTGASTKLEVTSTGIDVTGNLLVGKASSSITTAGTTITSSSLAQSASDTSTNLATNGGAVLNLCNISATNGNFSNIGGYNSNGLVVSQMNFINVNHTSRTGAITFSTHDGSTLNERMRIASNGDISFYEDTGTTAKLFWDSSAEKLGIGTSSPSAPIDAITDSTAYVGKFTQSNTSNGDGVFIQVGSTASSDYALTVRSDAGNTSGLAVKADGNVGIGTFSPNATLHVQTSHTSTDVTDANNNDTLNIANNGAGNGVYNAIKFSGNQQDMYIMSFNNNAQASRRMGFFLGSVAGDAATDERLSITGNGLVGIGTSSPSTLLHVKSTGSATATIEGAGGGDAILDLKAAEVSGGESIIRFSDSVSGVGFITYAQNDGGSDFMRFGTASTERMRIDSSGNLLVGKSSTAFGTQGIVLNANGVIDVTKDGDAALFLNRLTSDGAIAIFHKAGTDVGSIDVTASATSYNTSSDQRLKDNIVDAPSASDDIDAIQVRSFDWKADGSHQKYGMVAQELQSVAPEAVTGDADSDEMMGIDYSKLVPMMLKEIQSLRARVAELESN